MSTLINTLEGRAQKYSSNNYLYGRALELAGQSVVSLYDNTPCPLGVSSSRRLGSRVAVAGVFTVLFGIFAAVAGTIAWHMSDPASSFSAMGSTSTPPRIIVLPFVLMPALAIGLMWFATLRGQSDKKRGQEMIARGQQLMASSSKVDETQMRADMEVIWAESMRMAAMRANRAAMMNNAAMMNEATMMNNGMMDLDHDGMMGGGMMGGGMMDPDHDGM